MVADKFQPFRSAIEQFIESIKSGSPNVDQFKNNVSDLAAQFRDDASIQKFAVELLKIAESADTVSVKLQQTQAAIARLSDEASGAAASARTLATSLRALEGISPTRIDDYTRAQNTLNEALKDQNLTTDQRNKLIAAGEAAMKRAAEAEAARAKPAGGGAPVDDGMTAQMERRMQFIRDSTLTEEGLLIARYERNRALAQEYFALEMAESGLQGEQRAALKAEQDATIEALDAKHQQNLARMRAAADAVMLNNLGSTFGNIGSIIESGGKRGTAAAKAMYIAQALMSTFAAATQAMANPMLMDPFSKFAAYAAVATKGLAAVASIAKVGGGGGGGAAGAGAAAGAGGATGGGGGTMGNSVYVNLQGQSFGRDQVRSLVESIAQYQKDGGQVIFA
jgi:hypothetical protein